ncbi:MAG: NifB/NifX family molybdenum-iron cluster-binding protein [Spirochaetota bacterium]
MTVCVSATGCTLDHQVDPRFGRCRYFLFVNTETLEFEAVANPNIDAGGGAGVQSGQLLSTRGAGALLTGNVGPNAYRTLQAAGVTIYTGVHGTAREAVQRYKKGEFNATHNPTVESKFGAG